MPNDNHVDGASWLRNTERLRGRRAPGDWLRLGDWLRPITTRLRPIASRLAWALLALGVLCSLVVYWMSTDYAIGQAQGDPPSIAMAYTFVELPWLVGGTVLMLSGALLLVTRSRWNRPEVVSATVAAILVWQVIAVTAWPVSWIVSSL
jgi:hypothetical protein